MTVSFPRLLLAILIGSLAAGPIFVTAGFIGAALVEGSPFGEGRGSIGVGGFGLFLVVSMLYGTFIALIPNVIGTALLGLLGRHIALVRHPLFWGLSGGAFGLLIGFWMSFGPDYGFAVLLGVTGALCALTCRYFVRWGSKVAPVDEAAFD